MAGDWLKIEKATPRKPEMFRIASALGISRAEAFLLCFEFWAWADENTSDGVLVGMSAEMVDTLFHRRGFTQTLLDVGWLSETRTGIDSTVTLAIPHFVRHLSKSAKKRADANRRKAESRCHKNVTLLSRSDTTPSSLSLSKDGGKVNGANGGGDISAPMPFSVGYRTDLLPTIARIVDRFQGRVGNYHTIRGANNAIGELLAGGQAEEVLLNCVEHYAAKCVREGIKPRYRLSCANFFAEAWREYQQPVVAVVGISQAERAAKIAEQRERAASEAEILKPIAEWRRPAPPAARPESPDAEARA